MQEKDMVNDILSMTNSGLTDYANIIVQCSDKNLRQTIQQIRNSDEQFQFNLYQAAEQKGYYKAAEKATPEEIQEVSSLFRSSM